MNSFELFAGAGGLALATTRAGFKHLGLLEWNPDACATLRENLARGVFGAHRPAVFEGDARDMDYRPFAGRVHLVTGGPPCQPFSLGGKHRAYQDARDMFPQAVRAVRELAPLAFVFENVRGLLRPAFQNYVSYITLQMEFPEAVRRPGEDWTDHLARLEEIKTAGRGHGGLRYHVVRRLLNAADYGVPQKRDRVVFVGFRSDLGVEWAFPEPTHSEDALAISQCVDGSYWERHRVARRHRPPLSAKLRSRAEKRRDASPALMPSPWRTVRDALSDLPEPAPLGKSSDPWLNHVLQDGARPYPGHTGSPLDQPAKTLKAGDHGVPGGENMLLRPDGRVRYFSVRESARLQTFPDEFFLRGSWSESMRQLGNAVPVGLGLAVASAVYAKLRPLSALL